MAKSSKQSFFQDIQDETMEGFASQKRVLSMDEYLEALVKKPEQLLRSACQYMADMLDHYGHSNIPGIGQDIRRQHIFDVPFDGGKNKVCGQEKVAEEILAKLKNFARSGVADKLILLHGPNGSAKSSIVEIFARGLENYSHSEEGAIYRFNWIFTGGGATLDREIGFESDKDDDSLESLAHVSSQKIVCRIPCELRCHPVHLIPRKHRGQLLKEMINSNPDFASRIKRHTKLLFEGDLCPKCQTIFSTLLSTYGGAYRRVLRHIQVERFYFSKRYRIGVVSIEPQNNVDASSLPLASDANTGLPPVLQNMNIFKPVGDLIDANAGMVEYSDFFKRPLETNKYLLTTSEKGTISTPHIIAHLNMVMMGTSNEKHLAAFKGHPDFSSFKGRMELIKTPYILRYSVEKEIYQDHIDRLAGVRHVAPHVARITALFAVMTRLRRPRRQNWPEHLGKILSRLNPLEKALLYDQEKMPSWADSEQRRHIHTVLKKLPAEFDEAFEEFEGLVSPAYEGRRGASPREMKTVISDAAQNPQHACLSPLAVIDELRSLVKDPSLYDFLRLRPEHDYHNCEKMIAQVVEEYERLVRNEINDSLGLVDSEEYERLLDQYIEHVKAWCTDGRVRDPISGRKQAPSAPFMEGVEKRLGLKDDPGDFRKNTMAKAAAFALENPNTPIKSRELFQDLYTRLEKNYHQNKSQQFAKKATSMLTFLEWANLGPEEKKQSPGHGLDQDTLSDVNQSVDHLKHQHGYCEICAAEALGLALGQHKLSDQAEPASQTSKKNG